MDMRKIARAGFKCGRKIVFSRKPRKNSSSATAPIRENKIVRRLKETGMKSSISRFDAGSRTTGIQYSIHLLSIIMAVLSYLNSSECFHYLHNLLCYGLGDVII